MIKTTLIAIACCAQLSGLTAACGQGAESVSGPRYRIAGVVVDSTTGVPVSRATVVLLGSADRRVHVSTQTNPDGAFGFSHIPAGKYSLVAIRLGYIASNFNQHGEYSTAIVTGEGQDTEHIRFPLEASSAIVVNVQDDFGEPVTGAQVHIFRKSEFKGYDVELFPLLSGVTEDSGKRTSYNLQPGEYYVAVSAHPWYAMNDRAGGEGAEAGRAVNPALDLAYPTTYYDNATNEADAAPVVLAPGHREQITVTLHAVPALHLSLSALLGQGTSQQELAPELHPIVFGRPLDLPDRWQFDPDSSGEEINGVAPGDYQLLQGEPRRSSELHLAGSAGAANGPAAASVEVKLRTANGSPLPKELTVAMMSADRSRKRPVVSEEVKGETCTFVGVKPGTVQFHVMTKEGSFTVEGITVSGKLQAEDRLVGKDQPLSIEITFGEATGKIEGFALRDGKGVANTLVELVPRDLQAHGDQIRLDQADSDGSFLLPRVAPGDYTVVAIEGGWDLDWRDWRVLRPFLAAGEQITVPANQSAAVSLPEPVHVQQTAAVRRGAQAH